MGWFLFLDFSRVLDITSSVTKVFHIPMFLLIGLLVLALSAGGVWTLIASRIGMWEMMFVVWVAIATVFSSWKTGSVPGVQGLSLLSVRFFCHSGVGPEHGAIYEGRACDGLGGIDGGDLQFFVRSEHAWRQNRRGNR